MNKKSKSKDPIETVKELTELTFYNTAPTQASTAKGLELIDLVKSLDINLKEASYRFQCLSKRLILLSDLCVLLDTGKKEFEEVLCARLSQVCEDELDKMIEMGTTLQATVKR